MESPVYRPAPHPVATIAPQGRHKTETEIPPAHAVTATGETEKSRLAFRQAAHLPAEDRSARSESDDFLRREIDLDPETEAMVFRVVEIDSGEVRSQVPSEALLKLRLYLADSEKSQADGANLSRNA